MPLPGEMSPSYIDVGSPRTPGWPALRAPHLGGICRGPRSICPYFQPATESKLSASTSIRCISVAVPLAGDKL